MNTWCLPVYLNVLLSKLHNSETCWLSFNCICITWYDVHTFFNSVMKCVYDRKLNASAYMSLEAAVTLPVQKIQMS